eukprot:gnl/MRDRNA2_/MRDRNA2_88103_c0_seq1.p1 gnl/MRDRNA2_/MRDRNA2_88103_c0~~gnl/MRDRNA2_/MRDRNA2_88103_c0_seq1.p1  ORF type:complete len:782 (+),score=266.46 gnl/MRDRNA2_/MRDRNA2_88103_c0_seq1:210-2348(+)
MLEEMLKKSKEDAGKDRDLYAKFKCYCDKNEAEKTEAIEENEKSVTKLDASIGKLRASTGELSTECGQLKADIEENKAATEEAEEIRKKAKEDFDSEESDMTQAIEAMDKAIEVLGAIGEDQKKTELLVVNSKVKNFMSSWSKGSLLKLKSIFKSAFQAASAHLTSKQRSTFDSFIQAPFTGTYTSQSGEILGILKNMKDTFEANLEQAKSAEKAAAEAHEKFMKIKKEELETMESSYEEKQGVLGTNDESLSSDMEALESAKTQLTDDKEFLAKLAPMCEDKEKEFSKRKMMRANEEAAISQAVAILNSESAADTLSKTKKEGFMQMPSFLQLGSHNQDLSAIRTTVRAQLQAQARRMKSLKLARVAAMLELGNPFTAVLDEIDKMLALLEQEQKTDEENKAWCETERDENNKLKEEELEPKIEDLKNMITNLDEDINKPEEGLKDSIKQAEKDINANREAQGEETKARGEENMAYQQSVRNFVDAQTILKKAITVLKAFYESMKKPEKESFFQKEEPAPPEAFEDDYKGQSEKGNEVIEMIEFILKENQEEEAAAHKDEEAAQHAYEDSMQTLTDEQTDLEQNLAKMHEELAEKVKSLEEARDNLDVTEKALKKVERYLEKIKPGCDFAVDNFDKRKENRGKEKKALEDAIDKLKGTPAFKKAELAAEQESWGECKDVCMEDKAHAKCKACLAGVSVPGYCVTHKDTPGC